jgi:hypothetical protein
MTVPQKWVETALAITGDFETFGDPWTAVSGDFDQMGISCGPLQWNIGQGSLQKLVTGCGQAQVLASMPQHGAELWRACTGSIAEGLTIVRGWQVGTKLRPVPESEMRAFLGTPAMRQQMLARVAGVAEDAAAKAAAWDAGATPPVAPKLHTFCWFFDLVTQSGGLKGLTRADATAFIGQHGAARADDAVCDWLDNRPLASGHDRDAKRNAALWRNTVPAELLPLFVLSYLRANLSLPQWRHVALNRRGTIAMQQGWVNGELFDLRAKVA